MPRTELFAVPFEWNEATLLLEYERGGQPHLQLAEQWSSMGREEPRLEFLVSSGPYVCMKCEGHAGYWWDDIPCEFVKINHFTSANLVN